MRKRLWKFRLAVVLAVGGMLVSGGGAVVLSSVEVPVVPVAEVCHEDQECWRCDTMGNHQCGSGPEATYWFAGGAVGTGVEVYPDGAGVEYVAGREVATFPAGSFVWPGR